MTIASLGSINSFFTGLINQLMAVERQSLNTLRLQKTELETKRGIFSDLGTKFSALQSAIDLFKSDATTTPFDKRAAAVSGAASGKTVLTATASTAAIEGIYSFSITALAREHRVRSDQQTYADQALNLSGTFVIGGAAARAQTTVATIANTVTGFSVSTPESGQKEIGAGTYYVETRNDATAGWQFRVVDADGKAVSIKEGTNTTYTSSWQSIPTGGGAYNTGRGLTITFGANSGLYQAASKGAGAAQLSYTAQGASITVSASYSLATIATAINSATYADGNAVTATVVDRRLVIAAKETGTAHTIAAADSSGTVLQSLGVLTGAGAFKNEMQTALNASFTVNTLTVTRSKNTGLDDVISGVTINLAADAEGQTATLAVTRDNAAVRASVDDLLKQFNALTAYAASKTAVTGNGNDRGSASYTRGPLADDISYTSLGTDLINNLTARPSGLPVGSPASLSEIGITLNDNLEAVVSDSSKFDSALASNPSGVKSLLAAIADKLGTRLSLFTNVSSGVLTASQNALNDESGSIDKRITEMKSYLAQREEALKSEFAILRAQIVNNLFVQQQMSSFSGGGFNFLG